MNKTDLVAAVAEETQITKDKAAVAVEAVIKHIQEALVEGDEVRLPGFGNFKVADRKATTARNPRTGETVDVPASRVAKFSPAKGLKEALND
ncbi:MAG: HU family DNA-binding protein [Alphaproteobacteria bacterium]